MHITGDIICSGRLEGRLQPYGVFSGELKSSLNLNGSISSGINLSGRLTKSLNIIGSVTSGIKLLGTISGITVYADDIPVYQGTSKVTPSMSIQSLKTKDKRMQSDIYIDPIPYAKVSNISDGYTVIIGG